MHNRQSKIFWYPSYPRFSLKTLKKIDLKLNLPNWYMLFCTFCNKFCWYIISLQFTKIYHVSNILNWTASIKFCKIWLSNSFLISETVFLFTVKTSNALFWAIRNYSFSNFAQALHHISALEKFSGKNFSRWNIFHGKTFFIL